MARLRRLRPRTLAAALAVGALLAALLVVPSVLETTDSDSGTTTQPEPAAPALNHVHGLGVEPVDGSLLVASHSGLFRFAAGALTRVGDGRHDLMGFNVAGPGRYIASGHPTPGERGAGPHLGLVQSADGGRTWRPVSLTGQADLHVLRARGEVVYAYDVAGNRFIVSLNGGRTWRRYPVPSDPVFDLAIDPTRPQRAVAVFRDGLYGTTTGGRRWDRLSRSVGYVAWPGPRRLFLVDGVGTVLTSEDGTSWQTIASLGSAPAAFTARTERELFVATEDHTIRTSRDGGRTWQVVAAY